MLQTNNKSNYSNVNMQGKSALDYHKSGREWGEEMEEGLTALIRAWDPTLTLLLSSMGINISQRRNSPVAYQSSAFS